MELNNKCHAKHRISNEPVCDRIVWDNREQLCIFHCHEKPVDEFKKHFDQEVERLDSDDKFDCRQFIFPGQIKLHELVFKSEINFEGAFFADHVSFGENAVGKSTIFEKYVNFRNAKFGNWVSFENVRFKGDANFQSVEFEKWAIFDRACFEDWAIFNRAEFKNYPSFRSTHFKYKVTFEGATVLGDNATFIFAQFGDDVFFSKDVRFSGSANFRRAIFLGGVRFDKMQSEGILDFRNVTFEKPNQVNLHELNLEQVLLAGTNVQDIKFQECSWSKIVGRPQIGDEIEFDASDPATGSLDEIELLYLQLQTNFEAKKRYNIAGDFYVSAMEIRRQQISNTGNASWRWLRRNLFSLIALYRLASFYGESYIRSFLWMFALMFILAFLYLPLGFDYPVTDPPGEKYDSIQYVFSSKMNVLEFLDDYAKAWDLSFHSFTFQRVEPYFRLTRLSRIVYIIESSVSATLLALFLLAVRRRFRR